MDSTPDQNQYAPPQPVGMVSSSKSKFRSLFQKRRFPIIFVILFAIIGTILLFRSFAATTAATKIWNTNADWNTGTLNNVAVANNAVSLATTAGTQSTSNSDLAQGKPVVTSSTESSSLPASNATDGNLSTRWASAQGADPQWLYVDLGATYNISEVSLNWEAAYAKAYQVQVSNDAKTWTTIYSTTTNTGGVNDLTSLSGSGRYVRMYGTVRGTQWGYSLWEMSVFGTPASPNSSTDLALAKPVVASSVESNSSPATNAVDGNTSTRWASAQGADPQWLYVDLGATYNISEVKLNWEKAYAKAYKIQVSNDAKTWTTVYSTSSGNGSIDDLTNLSGAGRYVRMYGTVRATKWGYSLWEMSVYGSLPTSQSYVPQGTVTLGFDAGSSVNWAALTPTSTVAAGTNITYQIRTSSDNSTWSAWTSDITQASSSRYIQVQATLSTNSTTATPVLNSLILGYNVTVSAPVVTMTASPITVNAGQSSTLTWASSNANSCTASGAWSGTKSTSGTANTGALSASGTYNLACTGSGGTSNASATVTVIPVVGGGGGGTGGSGCTADGCLVNTLFTAAGPVASPIPNNPVIDPNSAHYVSELVSGTPGGNVLGTGPTTTWGITYYYSSASDPTYNINFVHTSDWGGGTNPFSKTVSAKSGSGSCNPLHIPNSATPPGGFAQASDFYTGKESQPDSSMWIIDTTKPGLACFIWQASKQSGTWTGSFGGVFDLNGDGVKALAGIGVGSGMANNSPLESEIQNGVIPHAMNFAWRYNASGSYRYPATKTDGHGGGDMVEGMRFQLDPKFDCSGANPSYGLPGNATKAQKTICVALQKYGMYDGDSGGGGVSFQLQTDDFTDSSRAPWKQPGEPARSGGVYCNSGLCDNGANLGIPLSAFRLLSQWNGS